MGNYKDIIGAFKDKPGGVIEAYHALQREFNYIPKPAVAEAARVFRISEAQAYGVATFYSYLSTEPLFCPQVAQLSFLFTAQDLNPHTDSLFSQNQEVLFISGFTHSAGSRNHPLRGLLATHNFHKGFQTVQGAVDGRRP
jgi:hypothetical protein